MALVTTSRMPVGGLERGDDYAEQFFAAESLSQIPMELELEKIRSFIQEQTVDLRELEDALDETLSEMWDSTADPITLNVRPYEQLAPVDLISTDNKIFNKVVMVLSTFCNEVRDLKTTVADKYYPALAIFGEPPVVGQGVRDGDLELFMSRFLPFLLELCSFVDWCSRLLRNILHQLGALYNKNNRLWETTFKDVRLQHVYEALGELLGILMTLDEIMIQNPSFCGHNSAWARYKRMVYIMRKDPKRFSVTMEDVVSLERLLLKVESDLLGEGGLGGVILDRCLAQDFEVPGLIDVRNNRLLRDEITTNVKNYLADLDAIIGRSATELNQRQRLVEFLGLYVLTRYLESGDTTVKPDVKLYKKIWEMQKRCPIVHLFGNTVFCIPDFLNKLCPLPCSVSPSDAVGYRSEWLGKKDDTFVRDASFLYTRVCVWMVRMESSFKLSEDRTSEILQARGVLLLNGLILASQVANHIRESLCAHLMLGMPVRQSNISALAQCCEMIKAVQFTFHRRSEMVADSLPHVLRLLANKLQNFMIMIKKRLEGTRKSLSDTMFDILAAISLVIRCLNGCMTTARLGVIKVALCVVQVHNVLKDNELEDFNNTLWKIEHLSLMQDELHTNSNCFFLYWSRDLCPAYFSVAYASPVEATRLQYLLSAQQDAVWLLRRAKHIPEQQVEEAIESFRDQLMTWFNTAIVDPLCRDIETDLRLHIHTASDLQVQQANPFASGGVRDLSRFLELRPLRFFDKIIQISSRVGHYLDSTFYNLNTVALHDWKTYTEMRNLAKEKYGLKLTEVHLPSATVEQGLDVLEIMRRIHQFVSHYNYNMNNQIFVERHSDGKHLNTINIRHISNSIRTHGTGIMNTTVNYTYQYLSRKFEVFSQFLYDDHIKSRLIKDCRFFKDNSDKLKQKYPFDCADRFSKDMRKLGTTEGGRYFLDEFRLLITEIGNALGYVRMIRSGGLHYLNNAVKFIPDLQDIPVFEAAAQERKLSAATITAADNLDKVIANLTKSFAEGTDYFKMLVSVFHKGVKAHSSVDHLSNFHIIAPPLCLSYVEHLLIAKAKLNKAGSAKVGRGVEGAAFTDDGFPIGMAFLLAVLSQGPAFDSLHWFESVGEHFASEQANLRDMMAKQKAKKVKEEEMQTHQLTVRRLDSYQTEFELLYFTLDSARIFFRD